jgi:dolichol-phosphate mannosyltransferase
MANPILRSRRPNWQCDGRCSSIGLLTGIPASRVLTIRASTWRLVRFLMVGASGLVVNSFLLFFWTDMVGVYYLISAGLATQGSTLWNYALTEAWVFQDRGLPARDRVKRLAQFFVINNAALALRGPFIYVLTSGLGIHYLVSNVTSLVLFTLIRYTLANLWIWRSPKSGIQSM